MREARYPHSSTDGMQQKGKHIEVDTGPNCYAVPNGPTTYPRRLDVRIPLPLLAAIASGSDTMDDSTPGMVAHTGTTALLTSRLQWLYETSEVESVPRTQPSAKSGKLS